ncbi:MAG: hypothetical protein WBN23_08820, partial [Woeseia sp.]
MNHKTVLAFIATHIFVVGAAFFFGGNEEINGTSVDDNPASYILKGESSEDVAAAVLAAGGEVTHELGIINAVAALLTSEQHAALLSDGAIRIYADATLKTAGGPKPDAEHV